MTMNTFIELLDEFEQTVRAHQDEIHFGTNSQVEKQAEEAHDKARQALIEMIKKIYLSMEEKKLEK